jgi:hypothetical protein
MHSTEQKSKRTEFGEAIHFAGISTGQAQIYKVHASLELSVIMVDDY